MKLHPREPNTPNTPTSSDNHRDRSVSFTFQVKPYSLDEGGGGGGGIVDTVPKVTVIIILIHNFGHCLFQWLQTSVVRTGQKHAGDRSVPAEG